MRLFIAGASGLIGVRLVPLLVSAGHVVAGPPSPPRIHVDAAARQTPRPWPRMTPRPSRSIRSRGLSRPPHNPAQSR